ncbi:phytase [Vararia minispora EC-137]|uniref:Phytase n=1 Tax=Vararia minispora EC-137 TaxID=1314806 RepID=A0ACB8Q9S9_9AGAM|nr:phytase [Vararia minispora EC-137]
MVLLLGGFFLRVGAGGSDVSKPGPEKGTVPVVGVPVREVLQWAQYAPFVPAAAYTKPREGCSVVQVNLLQRHGARWPTSGAAARQRASVAKIKAAPIFTDPNLNFLRKFVYDFSANNLLPYGALQSEEAGSELYLRYSSLVNETNLPFVRAADATRVVDSATNWTAGVFAASKGRVDPILNVAISESGNCTLDDAMCPNAVSGDESATWLAVFAPPITARLNTAAPGANLTDEDTLNLMGLCPFHTLIEESPSPFCKLFTRAEFESYEYYYDVDKFYGTGYGNALGPVQGVGYINELLARLTGTPVQDNTQTNRTLDASPTTFPLDRTFYADFSHDNQMVAIYSAIGLFNQTLNPLEPQANRTWVNSRLVSFAARMVVEKLDCNGAAFVRVMVADKVQPLEFCGGDADGLCSLDAFVKSQRYSREDGYSDFEKCGFSGS